MFHRSLGYLSHAIRYMLNYLYENFASKLVNVIDWSRLTYEKLDEFADAYREYGAKFDKLSNFTLLVSSFCACDTS